MKWMGKATVTVVLVFLSAALALFLWLENSRAQARQEANTEMEQEIRPLELERHRLQQELDDLNTEYTIEAQGKGSLVLLFTNLDERIYTEIYPIMNAFGFVGVLALEESRFPGSEGCMNQEQLKELIDAGWECCLRWKPDSDAENWAETERRLAEKAGISCPAAVYFPADSYEPERETILGEMGFQTMVHHGEGELSLLSSEIGEGPWRPGAMGWEQKGAAKMLDEAVTQRGDLVFTVGTDTAEEEYEKDSFISMLEKADIYCDVDELKVMTLTEAREYRKGLEEGREELTDDYNDHRAGLEAKIKDLER